MKPRLALPLAFFALLPVAGCYRNAHLYPVQGPLAAQAPPPIYSARKTGLLNSGTLTVKLSDGEVLTGAWLAISERRRERGAQLHIQPAFNLAPAWDIVYGPGFHTAHVLGTPLFAQAILNGTQGTVLQVEMYRQDRGTERGAPIDIKGVAQDNEGNIYKLVI